MEAKQVKGLMEAYASVYANISESHFKVGDEVICKASGMEGEVVKLDKPDGAEDEKYYTVKREDGKTMKYAPNELKLAEKEEEEEKEEEKGEKEEKEDVKEAKNGGATKKSETNFHLKLDKLVHKTFGSSPEEKKKEMKEETEEVSENLQGAVQASLEKGATFMKKNPVGKALGAVIAPVGKGRETPTATSGGYRPVKEESETDLFDCILEHLVAEGYADTNKAALAIMANMSEEWKQDIVEAKYGTKAGRKRLARKIRKGEEIGKSGPGTGFAAVEKAAKKGGAKDPAAVAAAAMYKTYGGKKG
jgi:hypothetical protein